VLVTVHGGKFQTVLDKHVTHLVTAEASGVSALVMYVFHYCSSIAEG